MIRVILFFVLVGFFALGVAWLADRPGDVAITWQGWRIETSVLFAVAAIAALVVLTTLLWSFVRAILRAPSRLSVLLRDRRNRRGQLAVSHGLVAVAAGDARTARRFAQEAERMTPGEPLALLLNAQTAQLSGDRAAAERVFRAMARRSDTKLLGLRGLFIEAQRREDINAARAYAEEAAKHAPALAWAGQAVLEFRCATGDWAGALAALESSRHGGLVEKATAQRQRAVLLTAWAMAEENGERPRALPLALEAVKLAPTLVPAAALAGRLLAEAGQLRKASRVIESAWEASPHPDLAEVYTHLKVGDAAPERLARIRTLVERTPGNVEGPLAVARAAIDAHEFNEARRALTPLAITPTQRVAMLMAELEEAEHGDVGRARQWMARAVRAARDPAWTADGYVSDRWLPVSPVSGRLDAFEWKIPVAEIAAGGGPIIEDEKPPIAAEANIDVPPPAPAIESSVADTNPAPRRGPLRPGAAKRADAVIPLMHAPDDPGPEFERRHQPRPEPANHGWLARWFR